MPFPTPGSPAEQHAPLAAAHYAELGLAQKQAGFLALAIESYERALALDGALPGVWVNLGRAQRDAGGFAAAINAFRKALELEGAATTWSMLSNVLREAGRDEEAVLAARAALARDPWLSEAHLNEGAALHVQGRTPAASVSYFVASLLPTTRALALGNLRLALAATLPALDAAQPCLALVRSLLAAPADAPRLLALAELLRQEGRAAAAILCLEHALQLNPSATGQLMLAQLLWEAGFRERAEATLQLCIESGAANAVAENAAAYRLLGAWLCTGDYRPSTRSLALLERCPDDAVALAKLGGAAQRLGQPVGALRLYQRLAKLRPNVVESHLYLGTVLTEQGLFRDASQAFERALELDPTRWDVFSSLLFCLHLDANVSEQALFERHRAFGKQLSQSTRPRATASAARNRDRKLRVGYVSPDFCAHPISYFIEPILREHDRSELEVVCYSDVKRPDGVTAHLARLVTEFVDCKGWPHQRLSERIRADSIDILVDLAGHTANNRLPVFAEKPSPVQVSWLGYFDTTGVDAIDYRIADEHSVPSGAERFFVERVLRLPRSANCYLPPSGSPEPAAPPCLERGYVTFGCFNNPAKLSRDVCKQFARILHAVLGSRLLLKYRSFNDAELRQRYLEWFATEGIPRDRIDFEGPSSVPEFLAAFARIDIALDPFPYSGETTALHTLWMGVPLVTLEGPRLVQRLGSRVLRICGLDAWVASCRDQYLAIARELATDPAELANLRSELRRRLLASPLLDHKGITRELESAYRWMRQNHDEARGSASLSELRG